MIFHKIISKSVIATALLGTTLGGTFFSTNVHAGTGTGTSSNIQNTQTRNNPAYRNNPSSTDDGTNFKVNNSLLTLDSVPKLNFGDNSNNSSDNQGGSNILPLDSAKNNDPSRQLEVTDYRQDNSRNDDWTLTAEMNNVTYDQSNKQNIDKNWTIELNNNSNNTKNFDSNNPSYINTDAILNNDNGQSDNGQNNNPTTVMSKNSGSNNGYGVTQTNYDSSSDAKLTIPNVAPGDYSANINWNLSTGVDETNNVG